MVGAPFFALATLSPTVQSWFARTDHPRARDPFFLYAASNLGSFLGLLAYPLLIEPNFDLVTQARWFRWGYVLLIAVVVMAALRTRGGRWLASRDSRGSNQSRGDDAASGWQRRRSRP